MNNDTKLCLGEIKLPEKYNNMNPNYSYSIQAAFQTEYIWKDLKVLPVYLDSFVTYTYKINESKINLNSDVLDYFIIKTDLTPKDYFKLIIINRIQPLVPFKIIFVEDKEDSLIRVDFKFIDGAWSAIGNDALNFPKDQRTMNIPIIETGTIIHEFCHVLGMIHEHQTPINNPIQWNKEKLYAEFRKKQGWNKSTVDLNVINRYNHTQINGSNYDPNSVMLYYFSSDLTLNHMEIKENNILSKTDIEWILKIYPGKNVDIDEFYNNMFLKDKLILDIPKTLKSFNNPRFKTILIIVIIINILIIMTIIIFRILVKKIFKKHKD